ncbi:MAG: metalloregulator ArsR/SmtB family transcription factor [Phycisphaerae bacterium]|jgi:DNA-binding transcriptional ArsR family regulator
MKNVLAIAKALADSNRTRVLMFLRGGELCVCQIMKMLGLAPSTVSTHLNVLHRAGLLESRKEGRWIYYRLAGDDAPVCTREAIRWLQANLAGDPRIVQDAKKLKAIRKMSTGALCRRYKS